MIRAFLLSAVYISTGLIGLAYALAFFPGIAEIWSAGAMVLGVSGVMVSTTGLGVVRRGRVGRVGLVLTGVFLLLVLCFSAALLLPLEGSGDQELWLGLPRRAAIVLYGVGLVPLLILPFAYVLTFSESAIGDADLERLREVVAERSVEAAETTGAPR